MRASRAFVASLGASLSLVLAGSLALATISTVVAFRGWPGISSQKDTTAQELALEPAAATTDAAKAPTLVVARPAPVVHVRPSHARAAAPARTAAAIVASPTRSASGKALTQAHPSAAPVTAVPQSDTTSPTKAKKKAPVISAGQGVEAAGDQLGGAVAGGGKQLGDAISQVSPQLGTVVNSATDAVGNVVKNTTGLVGRVLDNLTTPPPPPSGN